MKKKTLYSLSVLVFLMFAAYANAQDPSAPSDPAQTPQMDTSAANRPSAGKAGVDPATYIIGPEDVLQVNVWKEPTLSGNIPVRPDGKISLVLVGDIVAAGKTPMKLGDEIADQLKKYIQDPHVYVVVASVNSQRIYLVGEVGRVGPLPLTAGMSPLQAIAAAGGLGPFANAQKIYILRGPQGRQQRIPFNYKAAMKGDNTQNIVLQPGDTIVVP